MSTFWWCWRSSGLFLRGWREILLFPGSWRNWKTPTPLFSCWASWWFSLALISAVFFERGLLPCCWLTSWAYCSPSAALLVFWAGDDRLGPGAAGGCSLVSDSGSTAWDCCFILITCCSLLITDSCCLTRTPCCSASTWSSICSTPWTFLAWIPRYSASTSISSGRSPSSHFESQMYSSYFYCFTKRPWHLQPWVFEVRRLVWADSGMMEGSFGAKKTQQTLRCSTFSFASLRSFFCRHCTQAFGERI